MRNLFEFIHGAKGYVSSHPAAPTNQFCDLVAVLFKSTAPDIRLLPNIWGETCCSDAGLMSEKIISALALTSRCNVQAAD